MAAGYPAGRALPWLSARLSTTRYDLILLLGLIALHLGLLWAFRYFPSQDGPSHLYNAHILAQYHAAGFEQFREFYEINSRLVPNWFGHVTLAGLMFVFSPLVAEKLLLSVYMVLLPLSALYAVRACRPDNGFLAVLVLPFITSYFFHVGFYNFIFAAIFFFFCFGLWMRSFDQFNLARCGLLSALLVALYFTHVVPLTLFYMLVGVSTLWHVAMRTYRPGRGVAGWATDAVRALFDRPTLALIVAFAPSVILTAGFMLGQEGASFYRSTLVGTLVTRATYLGSLATLVSFSHVEIVLSTTLLILFALIGGRLFVTRYRERRLAAWDGILLAAVIYGIAYLVVPDRTSGAGHTYQRILLFFFFALVLWFGTQRFDRASQRAVQIAATIITVGMLAMHASGYAETNRHLREYTSVAPEIEPGATLLTASLTHQRDRDDHPLAHRIKSFRHAGSYLGAERDLVVIPNYEAATDYFPLVWRSEVSPRQYLGEPEATPPKIDIEKYERDTGKVIDYVLVWAFAGTSLEQEEARDLAGQLEQGYEKIFSSPGHGYATLYRRTGGEPAAR